MYFFGNTFNITNVACSLHLIMQIYNLMTKRGVNLSGISEEILPLCGAAECPHDLEPSTTQQIAQSLPAILKHVCFFPPGEKKPELETCINAGVLAQTKSANFLTHKQL